MNTAAAVDPEEGRVNVDGEIPDIRECTGYEKITPCCL